jgi:hypothetical protein
MKNQDTILAIKRDINSLRSIIKVREAKILLSNDPNVSDFLKKRISRDQGEIKKLQKVVIKLEKEDRKIWMEALEVARGKGYLDYLKDWWIENWGWVWIGFLIIVGIISLILIIK